MSGKAPELIPEGGVIGRLPFDGWWLTEVSPTRRVPSHGTDLFGTTYAFDFVAVDDEGRTAPTRSLRTVFATEPPELFYAFGRPLYSPMAGTVVSVHDGEPDHEARRSMLTLIPYGLSQPRRIRQGLATILGNHVIVQVAESAHYVGLVHLQRGSLQVSPGDRVRAGDQIGRCGNSGNSTQPHLHIQAMDSLDLHAAKGVPLRFDEFQQRSPKQSGPSSLHERTCPEQGAIISRL
ncbi:M23 family metallopeptidase [Actinomyces sp. ZJ308]|uniref:M23 family metallopeptidase n=1 Tax=Actinomyces sp. ZJ308 TaxID=2708342 RepID=UPI00141E8026|nr:M23 family metallopeptidase [Actinomyces sp. ZJ308]